MPRDPARIASRGNAHFKALRVLAGSPAERRRQQRTLLDGEHLVASYLERARPRLVAVSESALGDAEVEALLERAAGTPRLVFADTLFAQIAPVQTPTGVLALIDIPAPPSGPPRGELVVLLDGIQDPGNVGTIIRSAAAAAADAVLLSPRCADPWSPRTLRAAMGAHFALEVHCGVDLVQAARAFPGRLVAAAGNGGQPPHAMELTGAIALAFGAEGAGLGADLVRAAEAVVSIPLARGIESLNVGAAAAVILFERARQIAARQPAARTHAPGRAGGRRVRQ
jgi:TrmH family RNA methyltransferase